MQSDGPEQRPSSGMCLACAGSRRGRRVANGGSGMGGVEEVVQVVVDQSGSNRNSIFHNA